MTEAEKRISNQVLEKIKSGQTKRKPRWRFVLGRSAVMLVIAGALAVGAVSFSLIIQLVRSFEIGGILGRPGWMRIIIFGLPYAWLITLLAVMVIGIAEFLRTKHGYRYRLAHIASACGFVIIFFGGIFYAFGGANTVENYLERKIPLYKKVTQTTQGFWSQPEEGLLSGEIISTDEKNQKLELKDWEGNTWDVDYSDALWRGRAENKSGAETKIIGKKKEDGNFQAEEVRPWEGKRKKRNTMQVKGAKEERDDEKEKNDGWEESKEPHKNSAEAEEDE